MVLSSSKDRYLKNSFLPLLTGNLNELIEKIDLSNWREVLTILIIKNSKPSLVLDFAERLESNSLFSGAQACFVYAGSSDKVFSSWIKQFKYLVSNGEDYGTAVHNLFFKSLLYAESLKFFDSEILESIYYEYLHALYRLGLADEAHGIIKALRSPRYNINLMILLERFIKCTTGSSKPPWKNFQINPVKSRVTVKPKDNPSVPIAQTKNTAFKPTPVQDYSKSFSQPEPKKPVFEPIRSAFPENKDYMPEVKKSPFVAAKTAFPPDKEVVLEPKTIENKSLTSGKIGVLDKQAIPPPPPPPVKREQSRTDSVSSISKASEPFPNKPIEHIDKEIPQKEFKQPEPVYFKQEAVTEQGKIENTKPLLRQEEIKTKELSHPVVPKVVPPPKFPSVLTPKLPSKTNSISEGTDISNMPPKLLPIAQKWESAIREGPLLSNPRILKDVEMKMQEFFNKLRNQEFSDTTLKTIIELTDAFTTGDFNTVNKAHLELTNKTWTENGNWLTAMKRIYQAKQSTRGK
jgi:hypothetical protein